MIQPGRESETKKSIKNKKGTNRVDDNQLRLTGRTIIEGKEQSLFGIGGKSITPVRGPIYQHMDPSPLIQTELMQQQ